jgi:hypothetical protein
MKIYFTITGTQFRFGQEFMEKDMPVRLEKEPDNEHDHEAIKVMMEGLGQVGYVANSAHTVLGESWSAGRLYDKIVDMAEGTILYVLDNGVLCFLELSEAEAKKHKAVSR